jgi:hypothetical protein
MLGYIEIEGEKIPILARIGKDGVALCRRKGKMGKNQGHWFEQEQAFLLNSPQNLKDFMEFKTIYL